MTPIGHESVVRILGNDLPAVTLLRGPASVGKRTVAQWAFDHHGVLPVDQQFVPALGVEQARQVREWAIRAPVGKIKAALIRLDSATEAGQNALLKILEEPPRTVRFVLTASSPPLDTITSRAIVLAMGVLTRDETERVLVERLGHDPRLARAAAAVAGGQVGRALDANDIEAQKTAVLTLLKAVAAHDVELFEASLANWDDTAHQLLWVWAAEVVTGRYRTFTVEETFGLHRTGVADKVLRSRVRSRARLAVRSVLESEVAR